MAAVPDALSTDAGPPLAVWRLAPTGFARRLVGVAGDRGDAE